MRARVTKLSPDSPMRTPIFEGDVITPPMIGERLTLTGHSLDPHGSSRYLSTSPVVAMVVDAQGVIVVLTESGRKYQYEELPEQTGVGN